ncbi:MAG: HAD-IA family hydrolase [Magnetococcales bacterium]|nr:HAD-IA family hydrolase [Magnetococcales bacterium]NGZ05391.1 HAD-IA family hydrolase [Magnetococcales bacterium]
MPGLAFDLVVFDCDGTLVDSLDGIVHAARLALAEMDGAPEVSREQIAAVVGLSLHQAMAVLLPEGSPALLDQAVGAYKRHYQHLADGGELTTPLFPGVRVTLEQLRDQGVTMAVATGKSLRGLERTLREQRLEGLFAVLMTSDQAPSKPHPAMIEQILAATLCAPDRTLMVGDTDYDLIMARHAGVRSAAVTYGCHDRIRLARAHPDYWLEQLPDLLPVVGI